MPSDNLAGLMMVLTPDLLRLPFISGLRSLPSLVGVHRLIWRAYHCTHPHLTQSPSRPRRGRAEPSG